MAEIKKSSYYYLGANSPYGFFSYYDQLIDLENSNKLFIIKGGPGTGKSSLMKKLGRSFESNNCEVEYIACSSDPDSLDGLVLKDKKIAFVDGTAPHTIDPVYPACCDEIINLGDFWDSQKIKKSKTQIIELSKKIKNKFESAYKYLKAAKCVDDDIYEIIKNSIQYERLKNLADRIAKLELKKKQSSKGKRVCRFISGITPEGVKAYFDSISSEYKNIYRLDDHFGICSNLLKELAEGAIKQGYEVIECYCPTDPKNKLEHLLIKGLSLAFVTSNNYHKYEGPYIRKINFDRYINEDTKKSNRQKIRFNQKFKSQFIKGAIDEIKTSKKLHDQLEKYYIEAMNFEKIDLFQKQLEQKLLKNENN